MMRTVCWYSCGAASAVATKLTIADNAKNIVIASTHLAEEHEDNSRFLDDCQKWFGLPITIISNEKYKASIYEVFKRERFLVGPSGAACTRLLKRQVRSSFEQPDDVHVFGYTAEEQGRADDFVERNPDLLVSFPLIERGLTKADCLAMIQDAGIELPAMYRLGYRNNNCIGCVKGGAGYWNKIRKDFPETFERMAKVERELGRTIIRSDGEGIYLDELPETMGQHQLEPDIECSFFCQMAKTEYSA